MDKLDRHTRRRLTADGIRGQLTVEGTRAADRGGHSGG